MLIIGILLAGMIVGAIAQLLLGRQGGGISWPTAFAAGVGGSFLGGLASSLLAGDGLALRTSGIIGSVAGAVVITAVWRAWAAKRPV